LSFQRLFPALPVWWMPYYPVWSLTYLAVGVPVMYGLIVYGADEELA
jgi:hypothetical protein